MCRNYNLIWLLLPGEGGGEGICLTQATGSPHQREVEDQISGAYRIFHTEINNNWAAAAMKAGTVRHLLFHLFEPKSGPRQFDSLFPNSV